MSGKHTNTTSGLGPWATMLDTGPTAGLSAFWRQRMARLSQASAASKGVSRTARVAIAAAVLAVLALPLVTLSRVPAALAEETKRAATFERSPESTTAAEFYPPPSASEQRILAELEKPTTMEFVEAPLGSVVDYLQDLHGIPIQLDHRVLAENGIDEATPVDRTLKDIPLRSALRLLLAKLEMAYVIENDVLLMTTIDRAEGSEAVFTRTYPVGDLVDGDGDASYHLLSEAITASVRPTTWDPVGGAGSIAPVVKSKSLVISQTRDVHDEVLQLLRSLRSAKGKEKN
jgi:hypothetical protein